jgi:hypothetical protein
MERRQLKTFLTQTGPALPLTRGPTCHMFLEVDRVEGLWRTENRNLEIVSAKNILYGAKTIENFFHPNRARLTPHARTHPSYVFGSGYGGSTMKDWKIAIWRVFPPKTKFFLTLPAHTHPPIPVTCPPDQTQCAAKEKAVAPVRTP